MQGKYYLPSEWIGNLNDVFILKIKGNSMINKGINLDSIENSINASERINNLS